MTFYSGAIRELQNQKRRMDILNVKESWGGKTSALVAACSCMEHVPGLRGFWPMSSFNENGDAIDLSGHGHTLSYNGNPTYGYYDDFAPYIDFDGTGDYLSRADEADLDILGTEAFVAASKQGLTLGGWFWLDAIGGGEGLITKYRAVGNSAYSLWKSVTDLVYFEIWDTLAVTAYQVNSYPNTVSANRWFLAIGVCNPPSGFSLYLNRDRFSINISVPISGIFNSVDPFYIGSYGPFALMNGKASLCFLSVEALSEDWIHYIFDNTRCLFGA